MRATVGLAVLVSVLAVEPARATEPTPAAPAYPAPACLTMDDLVRADRATLEDLYRRAVLGPMPHGFTPGRAIYEPGSSKTVRKSKTTGLLWKGKVFTDDAVMINRLPFGLEAVKARVFVGESWYDGQPTLVLDYEGMSRKFGDVRDEMREVAPGLYLGLTYVRKCGGPELKVFYTLDARTCGHK